MLECEELIDGLNVLSPALSLSLSHSELATTIR